jgi:DNA-binding response OmpR family regulator
MRELVAGWPGILAVDDDPKTLRYVRDTLTEAGHPESCRRAGDLPVHLRPGPDPGPGLRPGASDYIVKPFSPTEQGLVS